MKTKTYLFVMLFTTVCIYAQVIPPASAPAKKRFGASDIVHLIYPLVVFRLTDLHKVAESFSDPF